MFKNKIFKLDVSRKRFLAVLLLVAIIPFNFVPPKIDYAFSNEAYLTELALPAVVLVYSRVDYYGLFYIPWDTGPEEFTVSGYVGSMGSGFFVNPNGYLVTNGHVVFCFESKNYKEDSYTKNWIVQDAVSALVKWYSSKYSWSFTQDELQIILNYNLDYGQIKEISRSTYIILGEAVGDVIEAKRGISATVVNADPFLGRDLAILKAELSNTPSIMIEDSDKVKISDTVYAFGYPGVVTLHPVLSSSTLLAPSVTQGVISGKRLNLLDIPVIQHSAPTTHGNSGGPLLNDQGKVIGVNNMGSLSELGLEVAGFNFAVVSNVLRNFLKENGVENSVGETHTQFQKGLAFYYAKMYASAKKQFDTVVALFPYHWRAKQLSQECQLSISRGEKANSTISIEASPLSVKVGKEAITINGSLQHTSEMPLPIEILWPATQITLEYTAPDGKSITHTVLCSKDGKFTDTFTPEVSGKWSVKALWHGSEDHNGATSSALTFTATEPSLIETLIDTGLIYLIPVALAVVLVAIFLLKRGKASVEHT